jgi:iron complex outermembrane receptor protein
MKTKLTILFFLLINAWSFSQNGTVKGLVKDNNSNTLSNVNISVKTTTKGTQTNDIGAFEITNLSSGDYILNISYLGFKSKEVAFKISNNETVDLGTITLYEGNEILDEVVIEGDRTNKFSRKETAYVSKLPLKDIENTQVYSTITTELLQSQLVINFDDALKNAVGVESLWASTGRGGDGAGYYSLRGFSVQPQLVNGLPGLTNGTINPANIERIEVVKGPSATLFGNAVTSYGGLINVVTKKPYVGAGGEVSFTSGSYGLNQITGDFNTALDKENNIYFRLNTSYFMGKSHKQSKPIRPFYF